MIGLFRRGMRPPRNPEPSPEFTAQISSFVKDQTAEQLGAIVRAIHHTEHRITILLEKTMNTIDEMLDAVSATKTKIDGLIVLTNSLHASVIGAMGSTITPSQQQRIDAVFKDAQDEAAAIDKALTDNTIAATAGAVSSAPAAPAVESTIPGPATEPDGSQPAAPTTNPAP